MIDLSSRLLEAAHDPLTPDSLVLLLEEAARSVRAPASGGVDVEALTYRVASAKLGEGPAVRCEGPTDFEKDQAHAWVKRVLRALASLSPTATPVSGNPLRRVRHVRRGSEYEVLGEAAGQVSRPHLHGGVLLEEGDRVVVYRGADGRLWWRVPEEFSDGRFVDV